MERFFSWMLTQLRDPLSRLALAIGVDSGLLVAALGLLVRLDKMHMGTPTFLMWLCAFFIALFSAIDIVLSLQLHKYVKGDDQHSRIDGTAPR